MWTSHYWLYDPYIFPNGCGLFNILCFGHLAFKKLPSGHTSTVFLVFYPRIWWKDKEWDVYGQYILRLRNFTFWIAIIKDPCQKAFYVPADLCWWQNLQYAEVELIPVTYEGKRKQNLERKHELDSCTQQLQEQMKAEEQAKQDKHR